MRLILVALILFISHSCSTAQKATTNHSIFNKIEPMNWWVGMNNSEFQILFYGDNASTYTFSTKYKGVKITKQEKVDSPNYLFLYLDVDPSTEPGLIPLEYSNGKESGTINYEIRARDIDADKRQGFDASDVIYLMMPDRFANGNPKNDTIEGMLESADRNKPNGRHGGDIEGVMKHLDYIKDLGMTAIWFTPVFENDMTPEYGAYHGYAATDMYKIDRRFGTNEEYKKLVDLCHQNGMKVIMDMIHNHIGDQHWWMKDLPSKDWLNDKELYGTTNYRGSVATDPYRSDYDHDKLTKGWFVFEMPDLNQRNELLADYLIQNTMWWIEEFGIDGIRMDTYVYPDKEYMARWAKEIMEAYPTFNIVGEAWVNTVGHEAYWQKDFTGHKDNYNSFLPSVTDFPLEYALVAAFTENFGWKSGLRNVYYTLAQDHLYSDPMKNVIFLDNHDLVRYFNQIQQNKEHFKMGYAMLMTMRGIPQVYYGTELLFGETGARGDGSKRPDMPGGWPGDSTSVFTEDGRTDVQNEIYNYVSSITKWRMNRKSIHQGDFKHFIPDNNIYVYSRSIDNERTVVIVNMNEKNEELNLSLYKEILDGYSSAKDALNSTSYDLSQETISIPAKRVTILELN